MEIIFNKIYLKDLYEKGKSDKKHVFQPQIIRKYIKVINLMKFMKDVSYLTQYKSLNYEKLKGNKHGLSSIRINKQYRIEFTETTIDGEKFASICNITELSNHYK